MNLIPGNIPHIPRMKNTNLKAKQLKEDAFRRIAVGPMQGTIICFSMSPRCDILGYEYTYSAFCILKRYFTLLGFKNVEYVQKEDKYGTIFTLRFFYDKGKIIFLPPPDIGPYPEKNFCSRNKCHEQKYK
nr:MAG TPA_asm: hypothetical protein [Caudoviricetes sp.]